MSTEGMQTTELQGKQRYNQAIEDILSKTLNNMDKFGTRFPHVSLNGAYILNDNDDWTDGFGRGFCGCAMNIHTMNATGRQQKGP